MPDPAWRPVEGRPEPVFPERPVHDGPIAPAPWGPAGEPPCLLVPEPTPLLLLALVGRQALDLLLVPGAEVRIAEVAAEGLPAGWLDGHAGRVGVQPARVRGGHGRAGIDRRLVLDSLREAAAGGRGVFAIADDREARGAILGLDRPGVRLLSTRCFLRWIALAFGVASATSVRGELAWVSAGAGRA